MRSNRQTVKIYPWREMAQQQLAAFVFAVINQIVLPGRIGSIPRER